MPFCMPILKYKMYPAMVSENDTNRFSRTLDEQISPNHDLQSLDHLQIYSKIRS